MMWGRIESWGRRIVTTAQSACHRKGAVESQAGLGEETNVLADSSARMIQKFRLFGDLPLSADSEGRGWAERNRIWQAD
jgi:hypothetical protein